jgi:DNA-directed RNA polymerase subunit E'/Rpb7
MDANEMADNIEEILLDKIKYKIGNKCIKEGYIDRDSIQILSRSFGKINTSHFKGTIQFNTLLSVNICNPMEGEKTKCKIISINKMGILAENAPITIVIARQHHSNKSEIDNKKIGDIIEATIIAKRFELYDDKITAICQL